MVGVCGTGSVTSTTVNGVTSTVGDANGNTADAYTGSQFYALSYDAENRLSSMGFSGGLTIESYAYDSQNRRIWSWPGTLDSWGNTTGYTVNVYTPGGQKLAAYTVAPGVDNNNGQSTPFIAVGLATSDQYFGGRRLASMDQLGSVGNYFPWGEDKGGTSPQDTWNFATYWRDSVSGLDYANNRYYSNAYGRFMTPDPYKANNGGPGDPRDPGSWNKYAYTRGDPANRIDPTGTCDLNITSIAPDGTIVIDCIDFPTDGGGGGTGGGGGSAGNQPTSNPCQSLLSGGLYDSYEVCMAALQQSQQQQQCVQSFSSSSLGAATEFLSVVNLLQNLGSISTVLDWTLLPYAKVEALKVIQDLSSTIGNTDFYSIAGASQTASIETELGAALQLLESEAAAPLLFAAVPIATAIDAGVQQMCNAVPGLRFNSQ